jgi:hypothetical protein
MSTSTSNFKKFFQAMLLVVCFCSILSEAAFAQITFADDHVRPNSRKIRREAARYKAEAVKDSHLNMDNYSYKRGEPGKRNTSEELETDEIYYGPNPVKPERRFFKKKQ